MSATRSMGTLHGFCKAKAKDLDSFLGRLVDHDITADDVATVKELRDALKDQFKRTHDKWEALSTADADPFKDDDEYNKCKADYDESKLILDKHWDAAQSTLDRALTAGGGPAGARIDEFPMNERLHMSRHEDAV